MAAVEEPRAEIVQVLQGGVEQAHIHVAPDAAAAGFEDAGDQPEGGEQPGHQIHDRQAHAGRGTVRLAGQREISGLGLHQVVVARPGRARSGAAVRGKMRADDLRVGRRQSLIGQAELGRKVAAQIVHDAVRAPHQRVQHVVRAGLLQIESDASLVAVETVEELAVVAVEKKWTDAACHVAAVIWVLDLDHLSAEIGKLHGAVRTGAVLLEGDDAQSGERTAHTGFRSMRWRAMMMRCNSLVPSPITNSGASRYSRSTVNSFE